LSAFNARPLWNTAILGPLFLVSGLSTGAAMNLMLSKNEKEKHLLSKIDLGAIAIELFLITHLMMSLLSSTQIHLNAADMFLGGEFTGVFWVLVVGIGLLLPGLLEFFEIKGKKIPAVIPALLVLAGGLALRFVLVEAGQINSWIQYLN
jgi:formate-dependent nitrite reductase membrane component NrfD